MQIFPLPARLFCILFGLLFFSFHDVSRSEISYQPDAGFIPSLTKSAVIKASSNRHEISKIHDGDPATFWQSDAPLPNGFIQRQDLNFFYQKAAQFFPFVDGKKICDGDLNNSVFIKKNGVEATLKIAFSEPKYLHSIAAKLQIEDKVEVYLILKSGEKKQLRSYGVSENYQLQRFNIQEVIKGFELISLKEFAVFEIAALADFPKEFLVFDFLEKKTLGKLILKNWSGGQNILSTKILVSNDAKNWEEVHDFIGEFAFPFAVAFPKKTAARFLKLECKMRDKDWQKVSIFEVKIYDEHGEYGPRPHAEKSSATLQEMLGVNGYWSWGHNTFSSMLKAGEGPALYSSLSSHGRNYHDLTWDLKSPDQKIVFSEMSTKGTPAKEWLDWDKEYRAWTNAGMDIQASIQFYRFKDSEWKTPYQSAYNYGYAFARHFGATYGNGLICSIEIGNEPWAYDAKIYQEILYGMAKGAKSADPNIEVFPCALQAADPDAETHGMFKNYMGARIPERAIPYLDGINIHAYSYIVNQKGQRKATYPEHPNSTFWEVLNAMQWRDKNMPGKKIYLSEWGYDSKGGGEECTHSECVSEAAAANYSLRTLLIAARLGLHRATYYFFANSEEESSLYTRSGLTSSKKNGFKKKEVYEVLKNLVTKYGTLHFTEALQEDSDGWVYRFETADGRRKYLVAWKPVDYELRESVSEYILSRALQVKNANFLQQPDFNISKNELVFLKNDQTILRFSAVPVIFELEN